MDWRAVLELVVTVVFLAGIALALLCLVTIHRNPHFFGGAEAEVASAGAVPAVCGSGDVVVARASGTH